MVIRGDIFLTQLDPVVGSEEGKTRPCLVIQNDVGNKFSPTTIITPFTKQQKRALPIILKFNSSETSFKVDSYLLLDQIRTVDKSRLIKKVGQLTDSSMYRVDRAIKISLGLNSDSQLI